MELLDIVDESGNPTGKTVERSVAHAQGVRHRTAHLWLLRRKNYAVEILLQKRSFDKESFPGCYDISSAGHIPAGSDYPESAIRELQEELGLTAKEEELFFCGDRTVIWDDVFGGKPYHDRQYTRVFALWRDGSEEHFSLQAEEVDSVRWMDFEDCFAAVRDGTMPNCIALEELELVRDALVLQK